ncbi:MAG TPA: enolase C-terminal domain-like protein [Anaerolineales bacterium]|nr:enolase C-terminal domain-like protein [Anaerolineales bacterium]
MQIIKAEITPVEIHLRQPVRMAHLPEIDRVTAVFLRLETRKGDSAWGCAVALPPLTADRPADVIRVCQDCATAVTDLHPMDIEYSLARLSPLAEAAPSALCAFDLAFHDLLGLATGLPLYRLLGGYRQRIQTSITIPLAPVAESVEMAQARARLGFRMLKVKGGLDPEQDVLRVQAIHRALPNHILRLDADGGYTVQSAIEVARALAGTIEMLEQPTPADDLEGLRQVTVNSPLPVLADQSAAGPASVLNLAAHRAASGVSVKVATCGGLRCASQVDAIARAARMDTMVSCLIEPALLISAGLSFALSSPNVRYGDLDGHLDLLNDPSVAGFSLQDGWLVASDTPGLGCKVKLA